MKTIPELEAAATDKWDAYHDLLRLGAPDHEIEIAREDLEVAQSDLDVFRELEEGLAEILEEIQ